MSFSPDVGAAPAEGGAPLNSSASCVDDVNVAGIREELGLGPLTGGAVANVMKAAQLEGERILNDCEVGIAGPGIDYVRQHAGTVRRWLDSGRRFRVWTVDAENDVALCHGLGHPRDHHEQAGPGSGPATAGLAPVPPL